jgi:hypothetical protein
VATIRRCNREQLQSGTTVSITPLPPSQSLPFFPWDGRSPVSHPTCDVPFPPRRPGEYWKGMIPDRPLYQGVRGFVWDPKPRESGSVIWADRRRTGPTCVWPKGGPQGQTESGGIVLAATCWATSAQRRFHPKEALYLPTFSHLLIVNKLLSLSLSPHIGITSMHYPPLMHPIHNTRIKIDPGGGERGGGGGCQKCSCQHGLFISTLCKTRMEGNTIVLVAVPLANQSSWNKKESSLFSTLPHVLLTEYRQYSCLLAHRMSHGPTILGSHSPRVVFSVDDYVTYAI